MTMEKTRMIGDTHDDGDDDEDQNADTCMH